MKNKLIKMVKNISYKHSICFSIIVVITTLITMVIASKISSNIINSEYTPKIIGETVSIIICLILSYIILPSRSLGLSRKGFVNGIMLSWVFILYSINNFDISYLVCNGITIPPLSKIIGLSIFCVTIGLYEETMMRGLILNNFMNIWGNTKRGVLLSVVLSSIIFGAAHLLNILSEPSLINGTITQVFYAFIIGFFFACVYLRCRNLWAVAILHGFFDFAHYFKFVFSTYTEAEAAQDITIQAGIHYIVLFMPLVIIGLFLLRKVNPIPSVESSEGMNKEFTE